ncbi:MAG: hypothetical protein ACJ72E_03045 [Marmoricola sp.]
MNPAKITQSLNREADRVAGPGLDVDQVIARAGQIRRSRRTRASAVIGAVVVAVAVPLGITALDAGGSPSPAPAPATQGPSPSSAAPSPKPPSLTSIPLGPRPAHSYVVMGVLHDADGTTHRLPAGLGNRLADITPYLGGYLTSNAETSTVTLYDGAGKVTKSGTGASGFVTTSDGVETAYVMDGKLYSNPGSGMASGDGLVGPVPAGTQLIGYLSGGVLYETGAHTPSGGPELALSGGGSLGHDLDSLTYVNTTYDADDLVSGIIDPQGNGTGVGAVISVRSHKTLWTSSEWDPTAFSYDGKYVAATRLGTSDSGQVAILDAATGHVLATKDLGSMGFATAGDVAFDDNGNVLLVAQQEPDGKMAILRLSPEGRLDRATALAGGLQTDSETPLVIPAGPQ